VAVASERTIVKSGLRSEEDERHRSLDDIKHCQTYDEDLRLQHEIHGTVKCPHFRNTRSSVSYSMSSFS